MKAWMALLNVSLALLAGLASGRTYLKPRLYGQADDIRDFYSQDVFLNEGRESQEELCDDYFDTIGVRDILLTSQNYYQFKKENKFFILAVTSTDYDDCPYCCTTERLLRQAQAMFKEKLFTFDTKKQSQKIQIARVDYSKKWDFLASEGFNEFALPVIYVYFEGHYHPYDRSLKEINHFLMFINRILHPVVNLKSDAEVLAFMNQSKAIADYETKFFKNYLKHFGREETAAKFYSQEEFASYRYKTRVLVIVYEKNDYDEELKDIKQAARFLANREEIRIGLLFDQKLVRKYKKETSWFENSASFNSFILKRYDGEIFVTDMINNQVFKTMFSLPFSNRLIGENVPGREMNHFAIYINRKSIKDVEPFHPQIF